MLTKLVARFKLLEVTSLLTVESTALYFGDGFIEHEFSPVADNLLMLRYVPVEGELTPALRIVKTRGSAHDRGTHSVHLGKGGCRIAPGPMKSGRGPAPGTTASPARAAQRAKKRPR